MTAKDLQNHQLPWHHRAPFICEVIFLASACKEWNMTWDVSGTSYQLHIYFNSLYSFSCISFVRCLMPEQISVSAIWKLASKMWRSNHCEITNPALESLAFLYGLLRISECHENWIWKDKDDIFPFLSRHVRVSRLMCMFKDRFIKFSSLNERPNNSHQVNYFHRRWGNILISYPSEYLFNPKHGNHQ